MTQEPTTELTTQNNDSTAALFDNRSEEILTAGERTVLAGMLSQNDRVDLVFPDGMAPQDLWRKFDICARVFVGVRRAAGSLKLFIGRALCVIQDTPEIYESRGFTSFDAFISDEARGLPKLTGICRAELYKAKAVAKSFGPDMNPTDAAAIGFTKMRMVAGAARAGDSNFTELVAAAKSDTIPELSERIARMGLAENGDLEYDVVQIAVTKTQKRLVTGFLANPQVVAFCESSNAGTILERMIQEVSNEWLIEPVTIEAGP